MPSDHPDRLRLGFALPAVLAVTGVVTLIFLVAMTALASLTAEATSARARVRFMERALTAEATIAYLAATEPMTTQGFAIGAARAFDVTSGERDAAVPGGDVTLVRTDSRRYEADVNGPLILALRDQGGMINLSWLFEEQHRRLLMRLNVDERLIPALWSRHQDYTDFDSATRVGGAEAADYGQEALPPNRRLLRAAEFLSVLGARAAIDTRRWRTLRLELAADSTSAFLNVNAASSEALQILFGLDARQAEAVIAARENAPLISVADFLAASGLTTGLDSETLYTVPSGRVAIAINDGRSAWTYRARLTLSPSGLEQPFWIDQTETMEAPRRAVADTSNAVRFPYAPR